MSTTDVGTEADMPSAGTSGELDTEVLPMSLLDGTQPSDRPEAVNLDYEIQQTQSQQDGQKVSQRWPQHQHQTQQKVQHDQQNSSAVPVFLEPEQQGERGLEASVEDQARREAMRERRQAWRERRRQRRQLRRLLNSIPNGTNNLSAPTQESPGTAQAKIGVLQARLAAAESELEQVQKIILALEESLVMTCSQRDHIKECLEKSEAALEQKKQQLGGTVADYNATHNRLEETETALRQERELRAAAETRSSQWKKEFNEAKASLIQEREWRRGDVEDYNTICDRLEETKAALSQERELRAAAETTSSQWKKEFNELVAQVTTERPVSQEKLTDDYLFTEVKKLDFNIKKFAQLYFGDEHFHGAARDFSISFATSQADVNERDVFRTLPGGYFRVAQASLWSLLVRLVFGKFVWCLDGEEKSLSDAFRKAEKCMMALIKRSNPEKIQLDVEHKFHDWKAHATRHCLQSSRTDDDAISSSDELNSRLLNTVRGWLRPQQRWSIDNAAFARALAGILDQSLKIDKEISRQPTPVKWLLPKMSSRFNFDPSSMEEVDDKSTDLPRRAVFVCVSPGLMRRGTSSGGDFDNERLIIPVGVSVGAVTLVRNVEGAQRLGGRWPHTWRY
ncbi:hypothetical protein RB594_002195 [Gaeumannomyces avenae]